VSRSLRTLLFSTLYPSQARPTHGLFVEARQRELLALGGLETVVVAPVPWFPSRSPRFGEYAIFASTPPQELRQGMAVHHPRYALLPKIGMSTAPFAMAAACVPTLARIRRGGFDFDLIDAHYFYPDGVAAALLAKWFGRPCTITARGSDVNLIAEHAVPRRLMKWASAQAGASIGVSAALAQRLAAIGAPQDRIHVARNGVDLERFRPEARAEARRRLGLAEGTWLLSVGNLLPVKRHHLVIEALARLRQRWPGLRLAVVGRGALAEELQQQALAQGLRDAVVFAGAVPQDELRWWYSAADLLVLASSREGWPNVLLEAMACGLPVVASRVGGVPEIVTDGAVGEAAVFDTADALAEVLAKRLSMPVDADRIRAHAASMGWAETARQVRGIFDRVVQGSAA
jgi:glycosyltransferase involved in cell wall biosynthesis